MSIIWLFRNFPSISLCLFYCRRFVMYIVQCTYLYICMCNCVLPPKRYRATVILQILCVPIYILQMYQDPVKRINICIPITKFYYNGIKYSVVQYTQQQTA